MGIYQIALVASRLLDFYEWLIVIWCVMSWFPIREGSLVADIAAVLGRLVMPFLQFFRRVIPPLGGVDFSPMVAIMVLVFGQRLLLRLAFMLM